MSDDMLDRLVEGYREFHAQYIGKQYMSYRMWAGKAQKPRVMMVACSDSRVNPAILTHAGLGEIFMVNNVANLVPPYKEGKDTHHSTSAALEFALNHLKVEHIIVLGHSGCGGIKALMEGTARTDQTAYSFIGPWVEIAHEAKERVLKNHADCTAQEQAAHCEKESLLVSLDNLKSFPWVQTALNADTLQIHAWYFDVETGMIERYAPDNGTFVPLVDIAKKTS